MGVVWRAVGLEVGQLILESGLASDGERNASASKTATAYTTYGCSY